MDTNVESVVGKALGRIAAENGSSTDPKKRRGKALDVSVTQIGLAGNAVCLPDFAKFQLCSILALQNAGLFENDVVPLEDMRGAYADADELAIATPSVTQYHAGMTRREIEKVFNANDDAD